MCGSCCSCWVRGSSARLKGRRMMLIATYRQTRKIPKDTYVDLARRMYLHETVFSFFLPFFFFDTVSEVVYSLYLERLRNSSPQITLLLAYERTLIKQTMNCLIHTIKKKKSYKSRFQSTFYLCLFLLWQVGTLHEEGCRAPASPTHVTVRIKTPAFNIKSKP